NAYVWNCLDYADNSAKQETLCVKFKTSTQAKQFESAFNDAKKMNEEINKKKESSNDQKSSKSAEPTVQNETKPAISGQKQQEKPSTTIKPASEPKQQIEAVVEDDDIIFVGEKLPTKEQMDRAEELKLPSTFFLYEDRESSCTGCVGCQTKTPSEISTAGHVDIDGQFSAVVVENAGVPSNFPCNSHPSCLISLLPMPESSFSDAYDYFNQYRIIVKAKRSLSIDRVSALPLALCFYPSDRLADKPIMAARADISSY
ncbi:unnamed protein product, partial [Didymodactylos carnosus]